MQFYSFPPFSCVLRVLKKIVQEHATGIVVAPDWSTQAWYPLLKSLCVKAPVILRPSQTMLQLPQDPEEKHPLWKKLTILVCLVSGNNYDDSVIPLAQ